MASKAWDFVTSSGKRLIYIVGAIRTVGWLYEVDGLINDWAATHKVVTTFIICVYLAFAWTFWDLEHLRLRREVLNIEADEPSERH